MEALYQRREAAASLLFGSSRPAFEGKEGRLLLRPSVGSARTKKQRREKEKKNAVSAFSRKRSQRDEAAWRGRCRWRRGRRHAPEIGAKPTRGLSYYSTTERLEENTSARKELLYTQLLTSFFIFIDRTRGRDAERHIRYIQYCTRKEMKCLRSENVKLRDDNTIQHISRYVLSAYSPVTKSM